MKKRALIFGIGGQDGSYLAEHLLAKGYEVHGTTRHSSVDNLIRVRHLLEPRPVIFIHRADLLDHGSIDKVMSDVSPDEVYNEADQDHVGYSYFVPSYNLRITAGGVVNILEVMKRRNSLARLFQPLSATMFGMASPPQDEKTILGPMSPYAAAKAAAWAMCGMYRCRYDLYVSCGILYNHDSVRRGSDYLLQRLARTAVALGHDRGDYLNIDTPGGMVDIGCAEEFMQWPSVVLAQDEPDDFVFATGKPFTVRELAVAALKQVYVSTDRITETHSDEPRPMLVGSSSKAREKFGFHLKLNAKDVLTRLVNYHSDRELERG